MKRLGEVNICGLIVTVMEAAWEKSDNPLTEETAGLYDAKMQIIWIEAGYTRQSKVDTLIHEMLHALIGHSGLNHVIGDAARFSLQSDAYSQLEENIVSILAPHLKTALGGINKVKL
jgi:hypothetical protein